MKKTILHLTSSHAAFDDRIYFKESLSLQKEYSVVVLSPGRGGKVLNLKDQELSEGFYHQVLLLAFQKLKNKSDDFKYGKGKTSRLLPIFLINGNEKSPIAIDTQGFLSLQFESLCEPEEEKISEDMNVEEKCFSDFIIELKQIEHLDKIIIRSPSGRFTNKNIDLKDWMSFEDKIITILEKVFTKN